MGWWYVYISSVNLKLSDSVFRIHDAFSEMTLLFHAPFPHFPFALLLSLLVRGRKRRVLQGCTALQRDMLKSYALLSSCSTTKWKNQWFISRIQQLPLWSTPPVLWRNPRASQLRNSCATSCIQSSWFGPTKALLGGVFCLGFFCLVVFLTCWVTPSGFKVKPATIMNPCFIQSCNSRLEKIFGLMSNLFTLRKCECFCEARKKKLVKEFFSVY